MILWDLIKEGYKFSREELVMLSPYLTRHIKRFCDYVIDLQTVPRPVEENIPYKYRTGHMLEIKVRL